MSGDTIMRQWLMLQSVPRYPSRRSTTQITQDLARQGYEVTVRTVQRDLEKLSTIFGLTCELDGRTNHWYFPRESRLFDLPGMDTGAALALLLAESQASALFPPSTFDRLKPQLKRAREVLKEAVPARLARWTDRFRVIHRGPTLAQVTIKESVQEAAYQAVLSGTQLKVRYRGRADIGEKDQVLHPYVIVLREGVIYVVASAWDYTDLRHYALHRMRSAEVLKDAVRPAPMFDVDAYVNHTFRYPNSEKLLKLTLRMDAAAVQHLVERPLSADQELLPTDDAVVLRASVADNDELRWWILGFGPKIEVIAPKGLRSEIAESVRLLAERYAH